MRTVRYKTIVYVFITASLVILNACTPTDIQVTKATPQRSIIDTEEIALPNCGGTDKLAYTLGTQITVQKSTSVATRASAQTGVEVEIPTFVQASLQAEVERSYEETYASIAARLNQIEMSAIPKTNVIYTLQWEEQKYTSLVSYYYSGSYYQAPYVYTLIVPKIGDSQNESCPPVTPYQVAALMTSTVASNIGVEVPTITESTPTPQSPVTLTIPESTSSTPDLTATAMKLNDLVQQAVNATLTVVATMATPSPTNTPFPSPTSTFTPLPSTPIPPTQPTNTPSQAPNTPTVTPTQLRKLAESDYGVLLYEENFNKDTEIWVLEGDSVIRDGELRIAPLSGGRFDFDGQPTKYTFSDFIFETQFRHLNPTGSSEISIYLRFQVPPCAEWNCSIQLWVSGDWKALGARRINGDEAERITGDISAPELSSNGWNKLTVIVKGEQYQVFVNDVFVKSFTDSTYKKGTIILSGGADGAIYDYVRIYELP